MRGNSMILLRSTGKKEIELNDATIKRPAAYGWVIVAYGILVAGASILLQGGCHLGVAAVRTGRPAGRPC